MLLHVHMFGDRVDMFQVFCKQVDDYQGLQGTHCTSQAFSTHNKSFSIDGIMRQNNSLINNTHDAATNLKFYSIISLECCGMRACLASADTFDSILEAGL